MRGGNSSPCLQLWSGPVGGLGGGGGWGFRSKTIDEDTGELENTVKKRAGAPSW